MLVRAALKLGLSLWLVALLPSCEATPDPHRCHDYRWLRCRTLVLQPGFFGHNRCSNPWHELSIEQGVPICRCKRRPECEGDAQ